LLELEPSSGVLRDAQLTALAATITTKTRERQNVGVGEVIAAQPQQNLCRWQLRVEAWTHARCCRRGAVRHI
jgi:hypothetical protein